MAVYRLVALVADLNALSSINTQGYQTSHAFSTEGANHFSPFLAHATHKKGVFHATQGRNTPTKKAQKGGYRRPFVRGCSRSNALGYCYEFFSLSATLPLIGFGFDWCFGFDWRFGLACLLHRFLCLWSHQGHYQHLIAVIDKEH
jgi:hypothetical protein